MQISEALTFFNILRLERESKLIRKSDFKRFCDLICACRDWPTIPQLYVKGEFVGGCDIMTTMFKEGELETLLKEKQLLK